MNPYEPPVQAELVEKPTVAGIIRSTMLWMVGICFVTVLLAFGLGYPDIILPIGLIPLGAALLVCIYRILGLSA